MRPWFLALLLAGCGETPAREEGQRLFASPRISSAASNVFACRTCHTEMNGAAGGPLAGVALRPTYWGGGVPDLRSAVNQCLTDFMRSSALPAGDERGRALYVYLASLAGDASARPFTIVKDILPVGSGDSARGATVYAESCALCHGEPHTGAGRISEEASIVPDDTALNAAQLGASQRAIVIEKVRHGKYFGIGGVMPPFSRETIDDPSLGDLLAYLEGFGLPPQ